MTKTTTRRAPKGTPTAMNLSVMKDHFAGADRAPNRIEPTRVASMRRCFKAGLFELDGAFLVLTDAGRAAVGR